MTAELHTGIAATPGGYKAWVVGLSPYTPSVGHWDVTYTLATRDKAEKWVRLLVADIAAACKQERVTFKVRHWLDGVEQPEGASK